MVRLDAWMFKDWLNLWGSKLRQTYYL